MIFGKTNAEIQQSMYDETLTKAYGVEKFAIVPTKLTLGQWAWFEFYWEYIDAYEMSTHNNESPYEMEIAHTQPKKSINYVPRNEVLRYFWHLGGLGPARPRRYLKKSQSYQRFYHIKDLI